MHQSRCLALIFAVLIGLFSATSGREIKIQHRESRHRDVTMRSIIPLQRYLFNTHLQSLIAIDMSNVEVTTVVRNTLGRHLGPALVGEFVNRTTTFVTSFYLDRQATVNDKVKRVRLLLFKIHSVIEAAEAAMPIGNLSLCRWLFELQDAAREGDDLLLIFKLRYKELDPLQGAGHRGFFLSSLWEAFQKAVRAATDLFWHDYDVDRLTASLDRLEKISSDVGSFLALLELDSRRRDHKRGGCNSTNSVVKEANPCLSYGVLLKEAELTHMSEAEETTDRTKGSMLRLHQARGHHHDHH